MRVLKENGLKVSWPKTVVQLEDGSSSKNTGVLCASRIVPQGSWESIVTRVLIDLLGGQTSLSRNR